MPILNILNHTGKDLAGQYMYHFAEGYPQDLDGLQNLPFPVFYNRVKNIPYQSDEDLFPESMDGIIEVLARPKYLLNKRLFPALDCKKKSILCGAWASENDKPFFFYAVSEKPNKKIHHVIFGMDYGQGFKLIDPTFPEFELGQELPITYAEVLKR